MKLGGGPARRYLSLAGFAFAGGSEKGETDTVAPFFLSAFGFFASRVLRF